MGVWLGGLVHRRMEADGLQTLPGDGTPKLHLTAIIRSRNQKPPKLCRGVAIRVIVTEYESGDRCAIVRDVVMETLVGFVLPVYLPELEVAIFTGGG